MEEDDPHIERGVDEASDNEQEFTFDCDGDELASTSLATFTHIRRCAAEVWSSISRCRLERAGVTEKRLRDIWEEVPKRHKKKHATHVDLLKSLAASSTSNAQKVRTCVKHCVIVS